MVLQLCGSYNAAELSPPCPALAELRQAQAAGMSLSLYMEESVQELLRDAAERFKGWMSMPGPQHTELACRKVSSTPPMAAMELKEFKGCRQEVKDAQGRSCPTSHTVPQLDLGGCQPAEQVPKEIENQMRWGALCCWGSPARISVPEPHCRQVTVCGA